MKALFLDCFAGVSGPMLVGALVDLGVKPSALEWELSKLDLGDFHMHFDRQRRQKIEGIHFGIHAGAVHTHDQDEPHEHEMHSHSHGGGEEEHEHSHSHEQGHEHHHHHPHHEDDDDLPPDLDHGSEVPGADGEGGGRSHAEVRHLIEASELTPTVKARALAVYARIASAEAKLRGADANDLPLGDAGGLAAIADVICSCVAIETLGVGRVFVSNLHDGHGVTAGTDGAAPIPLPSTLEILRGLPLRQIDELHPLITATGAALVAETAAAFGPMPTLRIERIGYGIGTHDLSSRPHALRAVLGELVVE